MTPPGSPDDRAALLLEDRVKRVFRELPGAVAGQEEPVHQVRVAGRRLRVALPLLARRGEGRAVRRALRVLRKLTRTVGEGRDLDVILGLFEDRLAALKSASAEQRALLSRLRAARARGRGQVADRVFDLDIDGLRRNLRRILQGGAADSATVLTLPLASTAYVRPCNNCKNNSRWSQTINFKASVNRPCCVTRTAKNILCVRPAEIKIMVRFKICRICQ